MDSKTRLVLAAYFSPERTAKAAATALSLTRERVASAPQEIKTDGLKSYQQGVETAFLVHPVKRVVSKRHPVRNQRGCPPGRVPAQGGDPIHAREGIEQCGY